MAFAAKELLSDHYLKSRAALINHDSASDFVYGSPTQSGTVYISTADASGMMVSFIQSNYMGFGSGIVVPDTGISLQNRGCGLCWIQITRTRWRAASVRSTPSFRALRWTATASR
jgi:gamma-glutamyltranspeptidase/glutathione hydrolase